MTNSYEMDLINCTLLTFFLPSIFTTSDVTFGYFLFPMIKIQVINREIILRKGVYLVKDYCDLQSLTGCYLIIPSSKIKLQARIPYRPW